MGRTVRGRGSELARLGMGCVKLGTGTSSQAGRRLVREALDCGVTFFDTADAYGSGASERILGSALRSERAQVVIATKGGYLFRERNAIERFGRRILGPVIRQRRSSVASSVARPNTDYARQDFTAAHLRGAVDASLRRLGTDYIDLYQLHGPRELSGDDVAGMMDDLIRSGKVRRFGVGLEQVDNAALWLRVPNIFSLQLPFGPLDPQARTEVFDAAERAGARIVCRGVFGSGLFNMGSVVADVRNASKVELVGAISRLAAEYGVSAHQLAVWWVLAERRVDTMLVGMGSEAHIHSTVQMVANPCDDVAVLDRLERLIGAHQAGSRSQ